MTLRPSVHPTQCVAGSARHCLVLLCLLLSTYTAASTSDGSITPSNVKESLNLSDEAQSNDHAPTNNNLVRLLQGGKDDEECDTKKDPCCEDEKSKDCKEFLAEEEAKEEDKEDNKPNNGPNDIVDEPVVDIVDTPAPNTAEPTISPTSSPSISFAPSDFPSSIPTISTSPSVSPTGVPSSTPSSHPTGVPSLSPTSSQMPSMAPIPYTRSERVEIRYVPWNELSSDQQTLASTLDYTETSWNELGINPIENLDWARLPREQKNAASLLGYSQFSWDCWQNHYQSYRWIDLGQPYIQASQWWEELGWDIYSWNRYNDAPSTDDKNWYELNVEQRVAAAQLCYFRTSWDEGDVLVDGVHPLAKPEFRYRHWMDMEEWKRTVLDEQLKYSALTWNVLGLDHIEQRGWDELTLYEKGSVQALGFDRLSWDCWQNHFKSYTWDELHFFGLDFPYSELGWDELKWDGIESPPPSASKTWKELTPDERKAAAEVCYFRDNWDGLDMTPNNGDFLVPKVKQRYVEWDALPTDIRRMARDSLLYSSDSWNVLGTGEVEKKRWSELTDEQKSDAISIGFYKRTWDCFQNHYRAYEWGDLDRDVQDAMQVFGWSETSWRAGEVPPSYDNEWSRLSGNEQEVASVLCFFEDNWDGNSLETVGETQASVEESLGTGDGSSSGNGTGPGASSNGSDPGSVFVDFPPLDAEGVSDILNPTDPAPSSVGRKEPRRVLCIVSVAFGVLIQMLL